MLLKLTIKDCVLTEQKCFFDLRNKHEAYLCCSSLEIKHFQRPNTISAQYTHSITMLNCLQGWGTEAELNGKMQRLNMIVMKPKLGLILLTDIK